MAYLLFHGPITPMACSLAKTHGNFPETNMPNGLGLDLDLEANKQQK